MQIWILSTFTVFGFWQVPKIGVLIELTVGRLRGTEKDIND